MANEYAVNKADLASVAAAIRTKGGTSASLKFPTGFVSAIQGIKAGTELNFEVVGGTSRPSSPKANTIWVNTSTAITGWSFGVSVPTNPVNGMVYIATSDDSDTEFNALKENSILVYPSYAIQRVSNVWKEVAIAIYQNGAWADISGKLNILKNGVISSKAGSYVAAGGTSFTNGVIKSSAIDSSYGNHGHFAQRVDVSNFSVLKFHVKNLAALDNGFFVVGISSSGMSAGSYANNTAKFVAYKGLNSTSDAWAEVDISGKTGSYYIAIASVAAFTIDEIVLE